MNMKMKMLLVVAAAAIGCSAFAYTWTGGANDGGLWTTPQNWGVSSGYPSAASDPVEFNGDATVSLDTGVQTDIGYIKVSAGNVVITATSGSSLKINRPGYGNPNSSVTLATCGITVAKGASLDIATPLAEMNGRFDRQGEGELILRNATITKTSSHNMYFFNGTNSFVGAASLTLPTASVTFGVGSPFGPMPIFIRDQATLNVSGISTSASTDGAPYVDIIQDGEDTSVTVANGIELCCSKLKSGVFNPDVQRYMLKSGTLSAKSILLKSANPTNIQYVQEGGVSTFTAVDFNSGSAALRGGVMNFTGANDDFDMGSGTTFEISGGTLAWPRGFNPSGWPQFRYSGTFGIAVPSGSKFEWDWSRADVAPGSVFVHGGAGTLEFARAISTEGVGLEIAAGKTVNIAASCTVSAPRGSTEPWKVTLNNGSVLQLNTGTARVSTPLDLTVNGTGKVFFRNCRGAVVAHRLTVDGVEKAKGRYYFTSTSSNPHSFVGGTDKYFGSSIIVPHVWTGAGGDSLWSNPANWDANTVPNGTTMCADISRATTITLNENIALSCLVAIPNGVERKVTVTGSGSISLADPNNIGYDCALFVPQECELVLDVGLKRTSSNTMALQGGGRLTVKKNFPGCTSGVQPLLAVDGVVSFAGTTAIADSGYNFLSAWTYEGGESHLFIEDGATVTADRFQVTKAGYIMPDDFRQRVGTTTFTYFYLGNYSSAQRGTLVYYLDGGSMTVNSSISLGRCLGSTDGVRYPGGSFEMSGGTLTCNGIVGGQNQNFVRLYGGDLYLKSTMYATLDTSYNKIAETNQNDITFYLGGVTIHPTTSGYTIGAATVAGSGNTEFTGRNGDTKFDLTTYAMVFATGSTYSGPGGFEVVSGTYTLTSKANCTFTGAVTVKSGNVAFQEGVLNGPSSFIVENASSKIGVHNGCTVSKSPDRIVLAADSCLDVGSSHTLTVKRLTVNGVDLPNGTYMGRFGDGTVIVAQPSSWLDGTVGDLSYLSDGTTTTVDGATTLSSLTYYPATSGETNALAGAGVLTFSDGANIHVAKGDTLVINSNVVLGGKVTKTGEGEVVFNGGVTAAVAATDGYWLTVQEGGATFDGAVTGVRLITCGTKTMPVITLKEHCTVTDWAIVLTAWSPNGAVANAMGETHQNGATVDYSAGVFETLRTNTSTLDLYPLSKPSGGSGRYVLNAGTFKTSGTYNISFFENAGDVGTFEFVQNGGTFLSMRRIFFARELKSGVSLTYTLNGGRIEFSEYLAGTLRKYDFINFNGGTVVFDGANTANFADRQYFTVTVGGDVTFQMVNTAKSVRFPNDWTGDGTVTFNGGNYFFSGGLNIGGLNIDAGTVTLGENTALAATGGTELSLGRTGVTLNLDYDGQMPFKSLAVGEKERAAGVYSATQGRTSVQMLLAGEGELLILEGSDPGTVISIR